MIIFFSFIFKKKKKDKIDCLCKILGRSIIKGYGVKFSKSKSRFYVFGDMVKDTIHYLT